ncbi:hypothetical protein TNCV_3797681 [Trichonephila clavipes]|nr:hypothetical protein TNCV_3797681 [Trichonephila clavipes]
MVTNLWTASRGLSPGATEDTLCRGSRCMLNLSSSKSFPWRRVVVRRGGCYFRSHSRHLTDVQNHKAAPEEIQGIEVRRPWRPSIKSAVSDPPTGICDMNVVTQSNRKLC